MPGIQLNHKFSDGSLASAKAKRKDKRKSVVPRRNNSLFSFNLHPRDIYEYFKSLGFHLKRAIVHDLTAEMATENERMLLKHTLGVVERGTTNLLAWRRSTLGLAMFGTVLTWLFQVQGAFDSHDEWQHIEFLAFQNTTYNATQDFNIRDYFERVAKSTGAAAMRDVALARVYCAIALVIIIFFSIITLFMAAQCWDRYSQSRKLMLLTWLLAFAAPFGISTVPMRSFVRWDMFDAQANDFIDGVALHYNLDRRQAQVISACTEITDDSSPNTLEEARKNVDRMCSLVGAADTDFLNFLTGGTIAVAKENCLLAQQALEDGRVDDALEISRNTCEDVLDEVELAEGEDSDALKRLQIMVMTQDLVSRSRTAAELGLSLTNALWAIKGMVPSAVAIAPALLRGSLTVKTLIPQSSIPGMFVILLPWLYCPLVWVIYNVAFQMTGTLVLFFGLLMLAFGPMSYAIVGMYMNITKPMDDVTVKQVVRKLVSVNITFLLVAVGFILYFAFGQDGEHRGLTTMTVDNLFRPGPLTSIVIGTLAKFWVTTLAGVDFVVGEIASQRDFEVYLESGLDRGERGYNELEGGGRERILELLRARNDRLDDLCKANRNTDLAGADDYIQGKTISQKQMELGDTKQRNVGGGMGKYKANLV